MQIWLKGATSNFGISADMISSIGAVQNPDTTWSWALYPTAAATGNPAYKTTITYPDPPTALEAGLNACILVLP